MSLSWVQRLSPDNNGISHTCLAIIVWEISQEMPSPHFMGVGELATVATTFSSNYTVARLAWSKSCFHGVGILATVSTLRDDCEVHQYRGSPRDCPSLYISKHQLLHVHVSVISADSLQSISA